MATKSQVILDRNTHKKPSHPEWNGRKKASRLKPDWLLCGRKKRSTNQLPYIRRFQSIMKYLFRLISPNTHLPYREQKNLRRFFITSQHTRDDENDDLHIGVWDVIGWNGTYCFYFVSMCDAIDLAFQCNYVRLFTSFIISKANDLPHSWHLIEIRRRITRKPITM